MCAEVGVDAEEQGHRAILENTLDVELWKTELGMRSAKTAAGRIINQFRFCH